MTLILCDLLGRDDFRFSPYAWRTRMALAHKGLDYDTIGVTLTDKRALAAWTDYQKVPVLKHGQAVICDSWDIARYLDANWPDRPALFEGPPSTALARFLNRWVPDTLYPLVLPLITRDVLDHVHPADRDHYRATREARLSRTLEAAQSGRNDDVHRFREALQPVRDIVSETRFLCGDDPNYADYILFGLFQWARCTSAFTLLDPADPIAAWRATMLELFDGLAGRAPGYAP